MRKRLPVVVVLALFAAALLASACSKEEPKETKKEEVKKEEAAKEGEKGKQDEGKKDEAKKAEPVAGQPAPTGEQKGTEQAPDQPSKDAGAAVQIGKALEKVVAYGVTGPIASVKAKVLAFLPADLAAQADAEFARWLADIGKEVGFKNMDWLDQSRGIGFAIEGKDRPLLAIPIIDEAKFREALPETMKPDENRGYKVENAYILPYQRFILVSDSFRNIDLIEGDLKLEVTRLTTDKTLEIIVGGPSLKVLLSSVLDEGERSLTERMPMQQEQKEFLAKTFNFIKELIGDLEKLTLTLDLADKNLLLTYDVKGVEGSKLAATFNALMPGSFASTAFHPAKAFLAFAQYVPAEAYEPWLSRMVDLMASAWKLTEEEKVEFAKTYAELISYMGPDSSFSIYSDNAFPLCMTSVAYAKDGMKARERLYAFYEKLLQKMIATLPPENRQMFASGNLKQIVDGINPMLINLGVSLELTSEDYRGGKVDALVMKFDWEKLKLPPEAAWVPQVIRGQLGGALAFSPDIVAFTFGPNPVVRAKEVLDKTPGLNLKELFGDTFVEADHFAVFALSPSRLIDSLSEIKIVADFLATQSWVAGVKASKGLYVFLDRQERGFKVQSKFDLGFVSELVATFAGVRKVEQPPEQPPQPAVPVQPPVPTPPAPPAGGGQ